MHVLLARACREVLADHHVGSPLLAQGHPADRIAQAAPRTARAVRTALCARRQVLKPVGLEFEIVSPTRGQCLCGARRGRLHAFRVVRVEAHQRAHEQTLLLLMLVHLVEDDELPGMERPDPIARQIHIAAHGDGRLRNDESCRVERPCQLAEDFCRLQPACGSQARPAAGGRHAWRRRGGEVGISSCCSGGGVVDGPSGDARFDRVVVGMILRTRAMRKAGRCHRFGRR